MFDFNNDGKTTPDEDFIAYNIYSKTSCGTNYSKSHRSSGKIILGIIIALLVFYIIGRIEIHHPVTAPPTKAVPAEAHILL